MVLYFITGNENKFQEVNAIIPCEKLDIDLPEIQSINPEEIIKEKLNEAIKHQKGEFIVEDTSLFLDCLNGLPGPLIKWFLKAIGNEGIYNLAKKLANNRAEARTVIGYCKAGKVKFFEGSIKGEIVFPNAKTTFGWDPIFRPQNHTKTFAEMSKEEKNSISMRRLALTKLKEYLERNE